MNSPVRFLGAALHDQESVVRMTSELVRMPSQGGIDTYQPIVECLESWMLKRELGCWPLRGQQGDLLGLAGKIKFEKPGPTWVLNACLDTAPVGDAAKWTRDPFGGEVVDGWLWGRGSADSKVAVAVFVHIAGQLAAVRDELAGSLVLLFDLDEHTGGFGGAKKYFEGEGNTDTAGVIIGYPGMDNLIVGSRGVYRLKLVVHGVSGHSGSSSRHPPSAIMKSVEVVRAIGEIALPGGGGDFPLPPKVTVTGIHGGSGYSTVPDRCEIMVDVRTTPPFGPAEALRALREVTSRVDADDRWSVATQATDIEEVTCWAPYQLPVGTHVRDAMCGAFDNHELEVRAKVSGPSNIGNYLAGLGIPATAGWGVRHVGYHAADERIDISSIPVVQAVHHNAIVRLLTPR